MKAEIRCSGLARPMECAGFLFFENLPEFEAGAPAEEGTAAGELLERLLLGKDIPAQARNGVYFNDEMYHHLRPLVEEINGNKQSQVLCEQRIDWQSRSGVWIRGSYDLSFVREGRLYVDDLKYGWGLVEVKDNWQLLGYAIGEVIRRRIAFKEIVLRIHQPRPHHEDGSTREWVLTYDELLAYKERIDARMEQIVGGYHKLTTGKQCKYCSAAPEACPAFNRLFYRSLEITTEFVQDEIDEKTLAAQLDQVSRATEIIKIKKDSLEQLAALRIKDGKVIPGYTSEDRYGDRSWKDYVTPDVIETLTGKKVLQQTMLSPAQAEKAGVPKDFIKALVDRKFIGQRMVKKDAATVAERIFGKDAPVR